MSSAVMNEIIVTEVTEEGVLLSSTAADMLINEAVNKGNEEKLMKLFQKVCKRSDRLERKVKRQERTENKLKHIS